MQVISGGRVAMRSSCPSVFAAMRERAPAAAIAFAISIVSISTPPLPSAGMTCKIVGFDLNELCGNSSEKVDNDESSFNAST
jgi:hypothetical protein